MSKKKVVIVGGGTIYDVRSHLALAAVAYGSTARTLVELCKQQDSDMDVELNLTKMADPASTIETIDDLAELVRDIIMDQQVKIVFFSPAVVDFEGTIGKIPSGKYSERLSSQLAAYQNTLPSMVLKPTQKLISQIRNFGAYPRKDIFLVGFKTTCGASAEEQYQAGLNMLKYASCNLVLANDVDTRLNMIITPEEAAYHQTSDRPAILHQLVEMAYLRSHLTFTQSTIVDGDPVSWDSELVPSSLREIVDYCIKAGAYKKFRGVTAGHFAIKLDDTTFLTSRRKTDFNHMKNVGLVKIRTSGPDTVIAYGSKPSVGGQSQRTVFHDHPEYDCIVHFHCPIKRGSAVPIVSQREFECGSHQCGQNTSTGLKKFGNLSAVYLDQHGPNIVFHRSIDPAEVIAFINYNFDLTAKTGGYMV